MQFFLPNCCLGKANRTECGKEPLGERRTRLVRHRLVKDPELPLLPPDLERQIEH
jgi:hypothetical protein